MRKTTDEERPVKKTPEERRASKHTDRIERMKERRDMLKEQMKKHENDPIRHAHWDRHIKRINKHIKDYEDKVKDKK
jgi:small-conductance mechanosensitive channel